MNWREQAEALAREQYPREACGLVVVVAGRERWWPCRNVAESDQHFVVDPADYAAAEDAGTIVAVVHSHCGIGPEPSEADRVACEASGLEWHIVSVPNCRWESLRPSGYQSPLVGRPFVHGILDCYSLVRDWYHRERGILLPDYDRGVEWWTRGGNLYLDHFREAGFVEVDDLQPGDSVLMQICSPVPNHAAVYLGDNLILHHLQDRLSSVDVFGGYYLKHTVRKVRYAGG